MTDVVTDTHALIWYLEDNVRLSKEAKKYFELSVKGDLIIYIPAICLVEIIYLFEKKRIPQKIWLQFQSELEKGNCNFILSDLNLDIIKCLLHVPRNVVPDMPDRIICATAISLNLPLISRDKKIELTNLEIIW